MDVSMPGHVPVWIVLLAFISASAFLVLAGEDWLGFTKLVSLGLLVVLGLVTSLASLMLLQQQFQEIIITPRAVHYGCWPQRHFTLRLDQVEACRVVDERFVEVETRFGRAARLGVWSQHAAHWLVAVIDAAVERARRSERPECLYETYRAMQSLRAGLLDRRVKPSLRGRS